MAGGFVAMLPHDVVDLHFRVQGGRTMAAAAAAELAAFHERPIAFWGLAGPSACEVALSVANRVLTTARSAAGIGGEVPLPGYDLRVLYENLPAVVRGLAALEPPDPAPLLIQATQEVGRAIRLRALGPTAGQPDGPGELGTFYFRGEMYAFSANQWRILKCLSGKPRGVPTGTVLQRAFGKDGDNKEKALDQLRKRLNDKLIEYELPFKVEKRLERWALSHLEL
jgi:hypothetical protein